MELRGCFSASGNNGGKVLKWISNGQGSGHFTGSAAFLANLHVELVSKIFKNVSYIEDAKVGTRINDTTFDGCLGRLQSGTSDFLAVDAFVLAPNIQIGAVLSSLTVGFFATYDPVYSAETQEVVQTVQGISPSVWTIVFALTFFTSMAMALGATFITALHNRNHKFTSDMFYKTIHSTFKLLFRLLVRRPGDDSYGLRLVSSKLMILMMICLAFYVSFYATAIIKTNAVTLKRPVIIENYNDIINSNVIPIFDVKYRDHITFQHAKTGTRKSLIWEKFMRLRKANSSAQSDYKDFLSGKSVIFASQLRETPPPIFLMLHCQIFRCLKASRRPLFMIDESEPETLSFLVNSAHLNKNLSRALNRQYQKYFEAGSSQIDVRNMDKVLDLLPEDKACTDNRIVMPNAGFNTIQLSQIRMLGIFSLIGLSIALFLLIGENLCCRFRPKKCISVTTTCNRRPIRSCSEAVVPSTRRVCRRRTI